MKCACGSLVVTARNIPPATASIGARHRPGDARGAGWSLRISALVTGRARPEFAAVRRHPRDQDWKRVRTAMLPSSSCRHGFGHRDRARCRQDASKPIKAWPVARHTVAEAGCHSLACGTIPLAIATEGDHMFVTCFSAYVRDVSISCRGRPEWQLLDHHDWNWLAVLGSSILDCAPEVRQSSRAADDLGHQRLVVLPCRVPRRRETPSSGRTGSRHGRPAGNFGPCS